MIAITLKKGVAAFCGLLGAVLFLVGGYSLWSAPIEQGREGVISMLAAFLLHAIFWVLWS